jgi:hypothetical protein
MRYPAIAVLVLAGAWPAHVRAQNVQASAAAHHQDAGRERKNHAGELVKVVREATERYRDVAAAEADGYSLMFGCVSGPDWGAMGLHYVKLPLVLDDVLEPTQPEILIYEPAPGGRLKLTGADYLIFADTWHQKNPSATPEIMGQLLHLFESPNRFGLPAFYTLHVWAWKDNPNGTFVNWHPKVSCDGFSGR